MSFFKKNNGRESFKNYSWQQKHFYLIVSLVLLLLLVAFLAYSFTFLAKSLNRSFNYSAKKSGVHFNLEGLKAIKNKLPSD